MTKKNNLQAPNWLDRAGREYWRRVAPSLSRDGLLTPATADLLACACQAYSNYREAQAKLKDEGRVITAASGAVKTNPWLSVEKQAFEILARVHKDLRAVEATINDDELDKFIDASESTEDS